MYKRQYQDSSSSGRTVSRSAGGDLYAGVGSVSRWWSCTALQYGGCDGLTVRAACWTAEGGTHADCLRPGLAPVPWTGGSSSQARRPTQQLLLLTGVPADHSETPRPLPLTQLTDDDELFSSQQSADARASCCSTDMETVRGCAGHERVTQRRRCSFVTSTSCYSGSLIDGGAASAGAPETGRRQSTAAAAAAAGGGAADNFSAPPLAAVPQQRIAVVPSILTPAGCCPAAQGAAVDSALLYFSPPPPQQQPHSSTCLSVYPASDDDDGGEPMMGQVESTAPSTTTDEDVRGGSTVESLDTSSVTASVSAAGNGDRDAGVRSRSAGGLTETGGGGGGTGWDSLLNPARSTRTRASGHTVPASCGVRPSTTATAAGDDDAGGQLTAADTLGWALSAQQAAPSYQDQVQLATHSGDDGGVIQPATARESRDYCSVDLTGAAKRDDVHNIIDDSGSTHSYNWRTRDATDTAVACCDEDDDKKPGVDGDDRRPYLRSSVSDDELVRYNLRGSSPVYVGPSESAQQNINDATSSCWRERDVTVATVTYSDDDDDDEQLGVDDDDDCCLESRVADQQLVTSSGRRPTESAAAAVLKSTQQASRLSALQQSLAVPGDDSAGLTARLCNAAGVSAAGVTDRDRLPVLGAGAGGPTSDTSSSAPPAGVLVSRAASVEQPAASVRAVSDDGRGQVETVVVEARKLFRGGGGASMASDVTCGRDAVRPSSSSCSAEVFSTETHGGGQVTQFSRSLSSGGATDDDDVDRKLADELERLKNLVGSPKVHGTYRTATPVSRRPDDGSLSVPDPDECCDMDDLDDANERILHLPFTGGETVPECADMQHTPNSETAVRHRPDDSSLNVPDPDECCADDLTGDSEQSLDRQLADELVRLKTVASAPPKTATVQASHQHDDGSSNMSVPDPDERCVNDEHSLQLPFGAGKTADSVPEHADVEHGDHISSGDEDTKLVRAGRPDECRVNDLDDDTEESAQLPLAGMTIGDTLLESADVEHGDSLSRGEEMRLVRADPDECCVDSLDDNAAHSSSGDSVSFTVTETGDTVLENVDLELPCVHTASETLNPQVDSSAGGEDARLSGSVEFCFDISDHVSEVPEPSTDLLTPTASAALSYQQATGEVSCKRVRGLTKLKVYTALHMGNPFLRYRASSTVWTNHCSPATQHK